MTNRFLVGAGVALATVLGAATAQAQFFPQGAPTIWYFGGEGGWTSLDDQTTSTTIPAGIIAPVAAGPRAISANQTFNDGFNVGVRGGIEWGPWRFEEEFSYRQASTNSLGPFGNVNGNRQAYAFMTNAIYDFNFWNLPFTPHIGGGIGAVVLHEGVSVNGIGTVVRGSDTVFGYQAIAGIRYNINPALAFDLDYRYLGTEDATFRTDARFGSLNVKSGYESHSLLASLTMKFGPPPPPPAAAPIPPAPPPIARRVFLVFFDWDKDTITPDGMAIIGQAADAFKGGAPVQIQVTGYTDRSGSPGYNQRLSERRANNVANAMARMGVPRQAMAVSGRGENDNRVPTADGVREPQNRRVEIVFP